MRWTGAIWISACALACSSAPGADGSADAGRSDMGLGPADGSAGGDAARADGTSVDAAGGADASATDATSQDAVSGDGASPGADAQSFDSSLPPATSCVRPAGLADTSMPDRVVGTGTPGSCTEAALSTAVAAGGTIVFDCGGAPHTIELSTELRIVADTVLDGEGLITLSGAAATRILGIHSTFDRSTPSLTVQRMGFTAGQSGGPGGDTEIGGGAIWREGGTLLVVDSSFVGNHGPSSGQDVAGGAIYAVGGGSTTIVGSQFRGNSASNGGAVGALLNDLVIVDSELSDNLATGSGGNPGNGGNGGGVYMDGSSQLLRLCGVRVARNGAQAYGGGVFRVSNDNSGTAEIDWSTIEDNTIPDHEPSKAGGLYLQGLDLAIQRSTISGNQARSEGGLFVGPGSTVDITNTTIAENVALSSLAGGVGFSGGVTGRLKHVTLANNRAPGALAFAGATTGGEGVTLQNSIVAGSEAGNGYNPISCWQTMMEGGGNLQFPVLRSGGGSDDPDALCSPSITVADADLEPLGDFGGPTASMRPRAGSPALGHATGCLPTDQRGLPRPEPCTSGAVEGP